DVVAVQADQRELPGLDADGVELVRTEAQLVQFTHRIGLQVDPHSQRPQFGSGFQHQAGNTQLLQGERHAEAADAATGDDYGQGHEGAPIHKKARRLAEKALAVPEARLAGTALRLLRSTPRPSAWRSVRGYAARPGGPARVRHNP